jgi:uncharacterized pyridoxal phosphate-containing UPF0001 family protein
MTTSRASSADGDLERAVARAYGELRERIARAGRDPGSVTVVAVTKGFGPAHVRAAARAGIGAVGENYANELIDKRSRVDDAVQWQYLGALQSNKVARLCRSADLLAALARAREVELVARQPRRPAIYVEVDFSGDPARGGAREADVPALVAHARDAGLEVRGLMTVAPPEPALARRSFARLREMVDELGLAVCSMGMSDDIELALAAGASEVRVGRALFGPRSGAPRAGRLT